MATGDFILEPLDDDGECYECGGDGVVLDDCFDDTCCCADPEDHGYVRCHVCGGKGHF